MYKKNTKISGISPRFYYLLMLPILIFLFFSKIAYATTVNRKCNAVYASNPIIYALYINQLKMPLTKKIITTYIKIVNPAKYKHDRYNTFLWSKLYAEDKVRFKKLIEYVNSVKCFKEYIDAYIGNYNYKKGGFYIKYYRSNRIIKNGMRTYRDINFINIKHGNIYYMFHKLAIKHINAGDFNFIRVNPKKAEEFVNSRTGTFGHIRRHVFLMYYYKPIKAKKEVLNVKIFGVFVYNSKYKNFLLGSIK